MMNELHKEARDVELVRKFQAGDVSAFGELVHRHRKRLVRLTGDEDIVHDAFIKVWLKIGEFDETRGSFSGWITRIATNLVIDKYRPSIQFVSLDQTIVNDDGDEIIGGRPIPGNDPSPEEMALSDEEYQRLLSRVDECLGALERFERIALIWRICEEHTLDEVAEILGLKYREQAKRLVNSALGKFKQCYERNH